MMGPGTWRTKDLKRKRKIQTSFTCLKAIILIPKPPRHPLPIEGIGHWWQSFLLQSHQDCGNWESWVFQTVRWNETLKLEYKLVGSIFNLILQNRPSLCFCFAWFSKVPTYSHATSWPNTVAVGGLGSLSSQTQEIIIAGLSEIGMANPSRGDGKESVIFFFFL